MIKAVIFDFDGVIVESADVKTEAFRSIFRGYPDLLDEIVRYHLKYQGISRYVKFRYIYKKMLRIKLTKKREEALGRSFSKIVLQKVLKAPFVSGVKGFLDSNGSRFLFFIASGTPEKELMGIVSARGIKDYFAGIYGSPTEKADIINLISLKHRFSKDEMIYVGDSRSDRIAALKAGIRFIERDASAHTKKGRSFGSRVIRDIAGLEKALDGIEKKERSK